MTAGLAVLSILCGWLLVQYTRSILEVRSIRRQLEEIERGSRMELGVYSRQREMLALCRKLNELGRQNMQGQIRYEKAQKQLKQNITALAHDIRTPLAGASGYVQLAGECRERGRQAYYLQAAEGRLKELGDMLEELFLFTKLSDADFEPDMRRLQVLPLLGDCLVGMYLQFEEKGISPEVRFDSEGFRVDADEEYLRRIFHNLIRNALLHGTGNLVITQQEKRLTFENAVSETSRPDTEQIFEQFYKADSARRKGSSGLGLFIVKELMEKMGGGVKAELEKEKLRIILIFP
ncbi:HAMP domain-containing histidine kinase [Schaedlerella arabinosiphila]|uniref:histidine kinase n=1 Tax=Schaedlerella arabinosiphila TaxID=2044587 RepID=A0A9X5C8F4_9FIRM|nr:HAMP domain-containing sensor histidine kinase [Schaedlerella arabinosiphila]KAI4442621.1 Adaptive-response sensory-kinase SasA [Schaedlerella arabinosiphila]NDO68067.1 HAMP domain-containing histidine kinase [Schaedlerella arabinosiphila]